MPLTNTDSTPTLSNDSNTTADLERLRTLARNAFPGLDRPEALLDNAGGSQVPACVAEAIREHLLRNYVQLSAGYPASNAATETVRRAHELVSSLFNADGIGRVVLGSSTSTLLKMIADCHRRTLAPGDEIIVAACNHESNIGPWVALEEMGVRIRWWKAGDDPTGCPLASLDELLGDRTRLVCFPHVSNLLGGVVDVEEVTRRCHAANAKVVVDGVAFAAHRPIDVKAWGCDWYVYSTYKVFGPHMAALFGREEAFAPLTGPNHYFLPADNAYRFELGGVSHEGCAGIVALWEYLAELASAAFAATDLSDPRAVAVSAFDAMAAMELPLQKMLVEGLQQIDGIRLVGATGSGMDRVPTISLLHDRVRPAEIVAAAHERGLWFRHGHMYAYRLCEEMGIATDQGVVRISAVHYNTIDEMERTVGAIADAVR